MLGVDVAFSAAQGRALRAFDLDATACGRVALVFFSPRGLPGRLPAEAHPNSLLTAAPQVWFQDLSCAWHMLATSFGDYFRLLALHLGIPGWQVRLHCMHRFSALPTQWYFAVLVLSRRH